jgi:hypothetical protein
VFRREFLVSDARPWFKAKTYGWGWGLALTWQGWVTYAIYAALLATIGTLFPPSRAPGLFLTSLALLSAALIGICLLKGEKPRWRWGR